MSWSPDGERIAICGKNDDGQARILDFSIKNNTGQFLPLTNFSEIDDVIWLADAFGLDNYGKRKIRRTVSNLARRLSFGRSAARYARF